MHWDLQNVISFSYISFQQLVYLNLSLKVLGLLLKTQFSSQHILVSRTTHRAHSGNYKYHYNVDKLMDQFMNNRLFHMVHQNTFWLTADQIITKISLPQSLLILRYSCNRIYYSLKQPKMTTYHLQTNRKEQHFNRTINALLLHFRDEHQTD